MIFFNSLSKISDSLLMSEELTRILQNTYQDPEARLQNYRDKRQVEELLYRNGYYLDNRIETIAIFPENSDMFYYCTKETINPAYDVREEKMVQPYFRKRRSAGVNRNSSEWFGSGILSGAAALLCDHWKKYLFCL